MVNKKKEEKTNKNLETMKEEKIWGDMITCNDGYKVI